MVAGPQYLHFSGINGPAWGHWRFVFTFCLTVARAAPHGAVVTGNDS
jgi:hypothetical protein